ncbi:hypothetical protein [uncultured Tateyamaria sp.]|uniref:hypothetical protein n=1 Tax=uncultured Tateyamaria sp. TaxID=455651 RepID=UPI002626B409|nr:hypothetical protein [uncultured Tateyamaria sp.]
MMIFVFNMPSIAVVTRVELYKCNDELALLSHNIRESRNPIENALQTVVTLACTGLSNKGFAGTEIAVTNDDDLANAMQIAGRKIPACDTHDQS